MADSPVGQLVWILEAYMGHGARAPNGDWLIPRRRMLDKASYHWFSASGASAGRHYWERLGGMDMVTPVTVPAAVTVFPDELMKLPREWTASRYTDLRYWNLADRGGRHAKLDFPDLYVSELRAAFADAPPEATSGCRPAKSSSKRVWRDLRAPTGIRAALVAFPSVPSPDTRSALATPRIVRQTTRSMSPNEKGFPMNVALRLTLIMSSGVAAAAAAAPSPNPWNGTWRLDATRSSPGSAGAADAYRFTLDGNAIKWEIPSMGEVVIGRTDGRPMVIRKHGVSDGITLSVTADGPATLRYRLVKDGKYFGGGLMMLVDDGKAWVDVTWGPPGLPHATQLVYVRQS